MFVHFRRFGFSYIATELRERYGYVVVTYCNDTLPHSELVRAVPMSGCVCVCTETTQFCNQLQCIQSRE